MTINRELLIQLRDKINSLPTTEELDRKFQEDDPADFLNKSTLSLAAKRGIKEIWMQWIWFQNYGESDCGTAACAAGWTAILMGKEIDERCEVRDSQLDFSVPVRNYAREALGLTWQQAEDLFNGNNTRDDMDRIFAELLEEQ